MNTKKKIAISILTLIAIILYFLFLTKWHISFVCPSYTILNIYCPGCGTTRMIKSILTLNFYQSFRYNPLLFIAFPFILILLIDKYIKWIRGKNNFLYKRINPKFWYFCIVILVIYGIIRNIPAFDYLIPTIVTK